MYLAATVFAPFGTGTFLGGMLLSTTAPGGVFGVASWAVLPKNAIRTAIPPATRTSTAAYGSAFVMRWPVVGGPGLVAANSPTSGIVDANFGRVLARLDQKRKLKKRASRARCPRPRAGRRTSRPS